MFCVGCCFLCFLCLMVFPGRSDALQEESRAAHLVRTFVADKLMNVVPHIEHALPSDSSAVSESSEVFPR